MAQSAAPKKQSRRRGADLDEAVYAAVRAELAERGYAGVTREGVARRARTSKPVLYRRWSSRAEMVIAALWHDRASFPATPETGSLSGDLKALLHNVARRATATGRETILGLLSELSPESARTVLGESSVERLQYVGDLVERARRRGEIGPEPLPEAVVRVPLTLARFHAIVAGRLDEEAIDEIVDQVFVPLVHQHQRRHRGGGAPSRDD